SGGGVGIGGGLMVVGLAAAVRELDRVGRLLERPAPRPARSTDVDAATRGPGRVVVPARTQPATPARRPTEPRSEPTALPERPTLEPDRVRPTGVTGTRRAAEPPIVDDADVPLSPLGVGRPAQRPPVASSQGDEMIEPRCEPPPPASSRRFESARPQDESVRPQERERPKRNLFDPTWPSAASARRPPDHEPDPSRIEPGQPDRGQPE